MEHCRQKGFVRVDFKSAGVTHGKCHDSRGVYKPLFGKVFSDEFAGFSFRIKPVFLDVIIDVFVKVSQALSPRAR